MTNWTYAGHSKHLISSIFQDEEDGDVCGDNSEDEDEDEDNDDETKTVGVQDSSVSTPDKNKLLASQWRCLSTLPDPVIVNQSPLVPIVVLVNQIVYKKNIAPFLTDTNLDSKVQHWTRVFIDGFFRQKTSLFKFGEEM